MTISTIIEEFRKLPFRIEYDDRDERRVFQEGTIKDAPDQIEMLARHFREFPNPRLATVGHSAEWLRSTLTSFLEEKAKLILAQQYGNLDADEAYKDAAEILLRKELNQ